MGKRLLLFAASAVVIIACTTNKVPSAPSAGRSAGVAAHAGHVSDGDPASIGNPNSAAHDDKGYIDGWFEGEDVQLYYTKSFSCPPLTAGAAVPCELGALGNDAPKPGNIRTIYAIAAAPAIANLVDPNTLACRAGTPCLNHPLMIDLSRIGGSATAGPAAHNHIVTSRGGGWFRTVNVRVMSLPAWNQIAAARTLDKVRELQGDPTGQTGKAGIISGDTLTNIFFFIASWRSDHE